MTLYTCVTCQKEFNRKSTYDTHLKKKIPCKLDTSINNQCSYCNKFYTTKYNLNKHLLSCVKKEIITDNQLQIEELKKLLLEHQIKFEEQVNKKICELTETNQNITINDNSTNINIQIVGLGSENIEDLTPQERGLVCTSGFDYQVKFMQVLHCNKKLPQYNNIEYTNERHNRGRIKINNEWKSLLMDDFMNTVVPHIRKKVLDMYALNIFPENIKQRSLELTKEYVLGNEKFTNKTPKIKGVLYDFAKNSKLNKNT